MPPSISPSEAAIVNHIAGAMIYISDYTISSVDVLAHLRTKLGKKDANYYFKFVIEEMKKNIDKSIIEAKAKMENKS